MIREYITILAAQSGIHLSGVSVIDGRKVGCSNAHLLNLIADGNLISTLVQQSELEELQNGLNCERLEIKIKSALFRMQILLAN
jgi:hypothetical protein